MLVSTGRHRIANQISCLSNMVGHKPFLNLALNPQASVAKTPQVLFAAMLSADHLRATWYMAMSPGKARASLACVRIV
jgi:hypothetical protein